MSDLLKIKRNVQKMVDQGASEVDIDQYIQLEGTTIDDVRNFKSPYLKDGKDIRAKKIIPQITKGLYENVPFGKRVVSMLPNSEKIQGLMENTPEPENIRAGVGRVAGEVAPDIAMMAPFVQGAMASKLPNILKLGVGMGGYEGTKSVVQGKNPILPALGGLATGTALSATPIVAKAVGTKIKNANPIRWIQNINKNIKNIKNPSQFAKNVRQSLFEKKSAVGKAFGQQVDDLAKANPNTRIDLSEQFDFIKANIDDVQANPGLRSQIKSSIRRGRNKETVKLINELIDDPMKAQSLTIKQAQDIKTTIQQSPSIARKLSQGKFADYNPAEVELLDLLDDIKLAQSNAFPEMAAIRKPYAEYMKSYKNVKNKFKPGSLIEKMKTGFGDEEVQEMINVVLPENTIKDINSYRKILKGANLSKKAIGVGAGVEVARRGLGMLGQ